MILLLLHWGSFPTAASAWGPLGHRIVCAVALDRLDAAERSEVDRLAARFRQPDGRRMRNFTTGCVFADVARGRARDGAAGWTRYSRFNRWHYVNFPRDSTEVTREHCGGDCVLTGIDRHFSEFANHDLPESQRAEAMLLMAHWIADAHQPLHVAFEDDRGGNEIRPIRGGFYRQGNLHSVWDSGIVEKAVGKVDWWEFAVGLSRSVGSTTARRWRSTVLQQWIDESRTITVDRDLTYCRAPTGRLRCDPIDGGRLLGAGYQQRWAGTAVDRLVRAGVRLAGYLSRGLQQ